MALLLNARAVGVQFGLAPLFDNISLAIGEGDRLGLIGPNGSGKSTLLRVLAGFMPPDRGEVALRKGTRLAYVAQDSQFPPGLTVREVIRRALDGANILETDRDGIEAETLGRAGFTNFDQPLDALSGGWRKRLAIAEATVQDPAILLLDEPTNHLDLEGIRWLEELLSQAAFAAVIVSHDRYFLENVPTSMAELNRAYAEGLLLVPGNYSAFLEKKAEYLHAQAKRQESLENRVRIEMEWLRRGPKARTTKSKARIDRANEMIGELAEMQQRGRTASADLDFSATGRKTKRLLHLEAVSYGYGERKLFKDLTFTVLAGMRVGLVGGNGSGKTTLLKLLGGQLTPQEGAIQRADGLRTVYFDQTRQLDENQTLKRALAPDSDSVIYRDRVIHVASWAARFLFTGEQLNQPVSKLSGGERARVLIARLMLEPADVLLLDEPTNDLDIPTLEILEESLMEFAGALILVTHDRYLLDRVSTVVLGLDGAGGAGRFADYSQWEEWRAERQRPEPKAMKPADVTAPPPERKKLSYLEAREYQGMEARIAEAEAAVETLRRALEDPAVMKDGRALEETYVKMQAAQTQADALYARWAELEEKSS